MMSQKTWPFSKVQPEFLGEKGTGDFFLERNKNHLPNSHPKIWNPSFLKKNSHILLLLQFKIITKIGIQHTKSKFVVWKK